MCVVGESARFYGLLTVPFICPCYLISFSAVCVVGEAARCSGDRQCLPCHGHGGRRGGRVERGPNLRKQNFQITNGTCLLQGFTPISLNWIRKYFAFKFPFVSINVQSPNVSYFSVISTHLFH